jgi:hypothetical protein
MKMFPQEDGHAWLHFHLMQRLQELIVIGSDIAFFY